MAEGSAPAPIRITILTTISIVLDLFVDEPPASVYRKRPRNANEADTMS